MRKSIAALILLLLTAPLLAQSTLRETKTQGLSLYGRAGVPPVCRGGNVGTLFYNSEDEQLKFSVGGDCSTAIVLGAALDLRPSANTWTGINTFSNAVHLNGTVNDWLGGKLLLSNHTGAASTQYEGGVQVGTVGGGGKLVQLYAVDIPIAQACNGQTIGIFRQNTGVSPAFGYYVCNQATSTWSEILANNFATTLSVTGNIDTPDTEAGVVTVTNSNGANFSTAIGARSNAPLGYGIHAFGGTGVRGESIAGAIQGTGVFGISNSTGDSSAGVNGQQLGDSTDPTFGATFLNGGTHAVNYGMSSFANAGPAGWFLNAGTNTQPTILIREGFGGQGATVPMLAIDNDANARNFAVRANGTIVHNGGVLDTVAAGAPSGACVTGSMYRRTDGTAGATLYICEAATWAAK